MPFAGHAGHNGRQGVWRLARERGNRAIRQVHVPGEHRVNGLQVAAVFQRSWRDPGLVVVAVFRHHHGNGAGGAARRTLHVCLRPHCLRVSLHHSPEVVIPLRGCPAFPVRKDPVRWDVEGVGLQLRLGSRLTSGAWCKPGLGRWGDVRVCPGEVRDPYLPRILLVVVEPPDQPVDEDVRGMLSQDEQHLEWPHADVGSSMWEEGRNKAPVGADVVELRPEHVYQVVRGRSVVDVVCPLQFPQAKGVS